MFVLFCKAEAIVPGCYVYLDVFLTKAFFSEFELCYKSTLGPLTNHWKITA